MGLTPEQARKLCQQAGAPLPEGMHAGNFEKIKNARRKVVDGREFRSTLEANVYQLLKSWEDAGAIRGLVCQPKYVLQDKWIGIDERDRMRAITYTPDFQFDCKVSGGSFNEWVTVVVDAKGYATQVYKLKAKLFRAKYPGIELQEWTKETLKANGG